VTQLKFWEIAVDIGYNRRKIIESDGMVDPVTLTAGAIAQLAFQKFIESGAGKLAEKFTEGAIAKMDDLRQRIVARLRGKSPKVDEALVNLQQGDRAALETVTKYLDFVMIEQPEFAIELQAIAHEITLMQIQDNSSQIQNNYGGTNYQVKTGADNTNFFGGSHQHGQK
jgi:hypothetical protein